MSLASPLIDCELPVGFLANPTFPSDSIARRYGRLQVNRVAAALPAFWTEWNVVSVKKVVIGWRTSVHPCQIQLLFEACQFGGKLKIMAFYREGLFLQIED